MTLDDIKLLDYAVTAIPIKEGGYEATFTDLPSVVGIGFTPEEAIKNAAEAAQLWIRTRRGKGLPVPEPGTMAGCNGKYLFRMPPEVHKKLKLISVETNKSLNSIILGYLLKGLAEEITA